MLPAPLEPFGLWVEQLVAESTGKQGVGVVPIAGETLGATRRLRRRSALRAVASTERSGDETRADGGRRLRAGRRRRSSTIDLPEPAALGAEFVRWEIATAVAGALLDINPFDEPNVQQAKDATRVLLDGYKAHGRLPAVPADATAGRRAR